MNIEQKQIRRLIQLLDTMREMCEEWIEPQKTPNFPAIARKRLASGQCLACESKEIHKRGLCVSCYGKAQRKVTKGVTSWFKLVEAGKAAPEGRRGPKSKPSDIDDIGVMEDALKLVEEARELDRKSKGRGK